MCQAIDRLSRGIGAKKDDQERKTLKRYESLGLQCILMGSSERCPVPGLTTLTLNESVWLRWSEGESQ